jgi:uncharacterized protein YkwD
MREGYTLPNSNLPPVLRIFLALATLVLVLPVTVMAATAVAGPTQADVSLLHEMNRVRAEHGLGPLVFDAHLERAAQDHSRAMLRSNVFTHGAFASRMLQYDVTGSVASENLAWGTRVRGSARGIVVAWLASPEHRANLLAPRFRRVGVGALVGAFQGFEGAHVVTADFAG